MQKQYAAAIFRHKAKTMEMKEEICRIHILAVGTVVATPSSTHSAGSFITKTTVSMAEPVNSRIFLRLTI